MNSMMYVTPIVFSYVSGINLSEEIENHFLGITSQKCDKVIVYRTKVLATIIIASKIFFVEMVGSIAIYYLTYIAGK